MLVTHDRLMLDRLATVIVTLDGTGGVETFADYGQWERAKRERRSGPRPLALPAPPLGGEGKTGKTRRRGYLEQREWDGMEAAILQAEAAVVTCRQAAEDPAVVSEAATLRARYAALDAAQAEVDRLYARWAELEARGGPA